MSVKNRISPAIPLHQLRCKVQYESQNDAGGRNKRLPEIKKLIFFHGIMLRMADIRLAVTHG
ncbi:MAG TPA: hypothetical protein PLR74_02990 [Agriterribacter sp.]|nr:hypothetical protein [Agriterribacter sp.]